jgi:hypothetical protein
VLDIFLNSIIAAKTIVSQCFSKNDDLQFTLCFVDQLLWFSVDPQRGQEYFGRCHPGTG